MSNIRVTYSGLIALLTSFLGVVTGTIFVLIVTRKLPVDEFGLWTLIGSLVSYVLVIEPIISYWTTRQLARGEKIGKTAFYTNGFFSIGGFFAFLGIAFFVHTTSNVDLTVLLLASALIPLNFLTGVTTAICHAHKPQAISYATMFFEITKIPLGYLFVIFFQFGLFGAIIATIAAIAIKLSILLYFAKDLIIGQIQSQFIKFWLRLSWLPLYYSSSGLLHKLDILLFTTATGSLIGPAYWGVSIAASSIVGQALNMSHGLYPKLIANKKQEIVYENLKRTMFFAIPILATSILFAKPVLHLLNPIYVDGILIVYFLAIRTFLGIPLSMFYNVLQAYENVDASITTKFSSFLKSKLFLVPTLHHIQSALYISTLAIFLYFLTSSEMSDVFLTTIWALVQLLTLLPFLLYGLFLVNSNYKINFPMKEITKYSIVTLFSSIVIFFIMENFLTYPASIWEHIPQMLFPLIIGGIMYFGIMYFIDNSTRNLYKSIINEFKNK